MLIRFNVKNFLSFDRREDGKTEEFSMISGKVRNKKEHIYDDGKMKLLKFAAIYGANAAGKSNLVKAMDFMRHTVIKGLPDGHTERYCKIEPSNQDEASYFELEILLNNKYYAYGFEVILSQSKFIAEWLIELNTDNSEKVIFQRDILTGKYELGKDLRHKGLYEKIDVYASDVSDDTSVLFLNLMNQNKKNLYNEFDDAAIIRDVFLWIKEQFDINYPDQPISDYSYLAKAKEVQEVCRVISAFGTGITDFRMVDVPVEKVLGELPQKLQKRIISDIEQKQAEIRGNEKLSEIFLQLHISEKSGRGVPKITEMYGKDAFSFRENSIVVTIPFERINKVGNKVGKKVGNKKPLNSRRQKIIAEMRYNPNITTAELHNILGVSETAVEKNISFLRENGYIERVGSKKAGYWKVL